MQAENPGKCQSIKHPWFTSWLAYDKSGCLQPSQPLLVKHATGHWSTSIMP